MKYHFTHQSELSWFMIGRRNLLVGLLDDITEPILSPLRRIVPRLGIFEGEGTAQILKNNLFTISLKRASTLPLSLCPSRGCLTLGIV